MNKFDQLILSGVLLFRLFVALDLPTPLKKQISSLCFGVSGVRWVPQENLHLTLRFIGEVPRPLYQEIREALHSIDFHPFEITTGQLGCFEGGRGPQTLWLGIEENEDLVNLQHEVEKTLRRLKIPLDKKTFRPHISLGRLEDFFGGDLQAFFDQGFDLKKHTFEVHSFELFSSKLGGLAPQYLVEESYSLD